MTTCDFDHIRYKCVEAINALSKVVPKDSGAQLFEQAKTFRLFVYLHNYPQPFTIQLYVPRPALHNPLIVTTERKSYTVRTMEECKVLTDHYIERRKWIAQYSAVVIESQLKKEIGRVFGANFQEKRTFFLFDEFANYTGARVNGTIFNIYLGSQENALENLSAVLEGLATVFPNYDNIYQLHIGIKDDLWLPVLLYVPPVGACYEEVFEEKDVLAELLGTSLDELQKQGIITEEEKAEILKKQPQLLM